MTDRSVERFVGQKSINELRSLTPSDLIAEQKKRAIDHLSSAFATGSVEPSRKEILEKVYQCLVNPVEGQLFNMDIYSAEELSRLEDHHVTRYLFHRYRYVVYPKTYQVDEYPPCVQIEPASICNFRCTFCYQSDPTFTSNKSGLMGTMKLETFKKIVDEIEGKVDFITLASRGEPLLAKDFVPMIKYASGKFLSLKVNTNASLLKDEAIHAILSTGVSTLVFSADAAEEELYKKYRVNGTLEKTVKNIQRFNEIKKSDYPDSKIITRVSGVLMDPEVQKLDDMEKFWGRFVDQVAFVNYSPWEKIYQTPENDIEKPCSYLWRRMFVWQDGTASPCDSDYKATMKLGSLSDMTVSQLWNSEFFQQLRSDHLSSLRKNREPCKRCIVT